MARIKAIQVGTEEGSVFYTTDQSGRYHESVMVDKITEEWKQVAAEYSPVGAACHSRNRDMLGYRLFKKDKLVAEIESGCGVILTYWED